MKYRFRATRALTRDLPLARLFTMRPMQSIRRRPRTAYSGAVSGSCPPSNSVTRARRFYFQTEPFSSALAFPQDPQTLRPLCPRHLCSGNRSRFARSLLQRRRCGCDGGHWFARSLSQIVSEGRAGVDSALPPTIAPDLQARLHSHAP